MKKLNFLTVVSSILLSGYANAQIQNETQTNMKDEIYTGSGFINTKKVSSEKATGSKYFIETFSPAKVGSSNQVYLVRHNAYTDEMEIKVNEEIKALPPEPNVVISLVNSNIAYEFADYTDAKGIKNQNYLTIISNTPGVKIYRKDKIFLKPESQPTSGYDQYKPAAYKKTNPEYYVKVGNNAVVPFSAKKKDAVKLVSGKEKEISDFIKENKISFTEDVDLNKFGVFLNTLL